jgi:hypothetical protein
MLRTFAQKCFGWVMNRESGFTDSPSFQQTSSWQMEIPTYRRTAPHTTAIPEGWDCKGISTVDPLRVTVSGARQNRKAIVL